MRDGNGSDDDIDKAIEREIDETLAERDCRKRLSNMSLEVAHYYVRRYRLNLSKLSDVERLINHLAPRRWVLPMSVFEDLKSR